MSLPGGGPVRASTVARRGQLHELVARRPLGAAGDEGQPVLVAHRHGAGRRVELIDGRPLAGQQPCAANGGMAGEVELDRRREDADLAAAGIVDEHGLAQAEVRRHRLAAGGRHLAALEEDRERIAA